MAISDATRLADFATGVGTDGTLSANNINATGIVTAATFKVGTAITISSGVVTATSFVGSGANLTGINSVSLATTAYGLSSQAHTLAGGVITISDLTESTNSVTGALIVSGGVGIAKSLHVGGNISVGGTLTYEDVTNQDVIGLATFRSGAQFGVAGVGGTITGTGNATITGIVTAAGFTGNVTGTATGLTGTPNITVGTVVGSALTVSGITTVTNFDTQGTLAEAFKTHTTAWNSNGNLNLSEGNLHYNSTNLGGTGAFLNLISTAGINTDLATGQALNVTAITAVNATTAFVNALKIDGKGTGITTSWVGGSVPTDGGGSAYDTYSFNILKTASETYIVIANQVTTS